MKNIRITPNVSKPVSEQPVEYVERKGLGHPDSLIDGIMENISVELSNEYINSTGKILHHNVDKGLIVGGSSEVAFGSGKITRPIEVILAGRAVREYKGISIDVDNIALSAAANYLKKHTRFLDIDNEVIMQSKIVKGSADLSEIFERSVDVPLANDTSFGIGFAPFTSTERLVLETEKMLNSPEFKKKYPSTGEDIKIMAVRDGTELTLTIAIAFVAQYVKDMEDYERQKDLVRKEVMDFAKKLSGTEVNVVINNGDSHDGKVYITKSGLSCEAGDDGSVGRGNRVNGLITPFRHMSLEAAAGKNPINHIGKIYSILSNEIANDIVHNYPQVKECNVSIVSQIGRKIDDPKHLDIKLYTDKPEDVDVLRKKVYDLADESLDNIAYLTQEIAAGKHSMF
ncbi:methionine adenosyltransferase [Candidatus Marsarchaeota archaeon]|nr:methionine adenosyltransferase [Candidatus Marsarchaeota archaeon]MCL5404716.1 methionine adenosyltransferase [Candidatus Marsarchaeota archaeon]